MDYGRLDERACFQVRSDESADDVELVSVDDVAGGSAGARLQDRGELLPGVGGGCVELDVGEWSVCLEAAAGDDDLAVAERADGGVGAWDWDRGSGLPGVGAGVVGFDRAEAVAFGVETG